MIFKKAKYRNRRTVCNSGHKHDSMAESLYCNQVCDLYGVNNVTQQPKIYLTIAKILYKPDFMVVNLKDQETFYVDVKGMRTPVFQIKMRLWKFYGPQNSKLLVVSGKKTQIVFGPTQN